MKLNVFPKSSAEINKSLHEFQCIGEMYDYAFLSSDNSEILKEERKIFSYFFDAITILCLFPCIQFQPKHNVMAF